MSDDILNIAAALSGREKWELALLEIAPLERPLAIFRAAWIDPVGVSGIPQGTKSFAARLTMAVERGLLDGVAFGYIRHRVGREIWDTIENEDVKTRWMSAFHTALNELSKKYDYTDERVIVQVEPTRTRRVWTVNPKTKP